MSSPNSERTSPMPSKPDAIERFGMSELVGFLFGRRRAMRALIRSKHALWLAAFLVFTAALAREYD